MPVITRSQSKRTRPTSLMSEPYIRVYVGSHKYRKVIIEKLKCPNAPRKPSRVIAKRNNDTSSVVRQLDFDEYPMNYRGFTISSPEIKNRVDDVYKYIDQTIESDVMVVHSSGADTETLKDLLETAYNNQGFWDIFNTNIESTVSRQWCLLVAGIAGNIMNNVIDENIRGNHALIIDRIFSFHIKFAKIFQTPAFPYFGINCQSGKRYHLRLIRIALQLAQSGLFPALIVLGEYRPELVCDECFPVMDKTSRLYQTSIDIDYTDQKLGFNQLYPKYKKYL
jgi:hypothetical protein